MFDTHCHLQSTEFAEDREAVLAAATLAGVDYILVPNIDLGTYPLTLELSDKHEQVFGALGIHPHHAGEWSQAVENRILQDAASNPKIRAIGEIGLDYHYDFAPRDVQKQAFSDQIDLAIGLRMPIIVHIRESDDDVWQILEAK